MPKVDPDVEKLFSRHLRVWNDALQRWETKCKPVRDEYKKSKRRRAPVADRSWGSSSLEPNRSWPSPPLAGDRILTDAPDQAFPGITEADEAKDKEIERRAEKCDKTIDMIKRTIEQLNHARATGVFQNGRALMLAIREKPSFISSGAHKDKVERGDSIEVEELQGDWMHVKGPTGKEGWVHKSEIMPVLPVELSSKPGGSGGEWEDEEGGARDTVNL